MKTTMTRTKKRSDSFGLGLPARIFSACRVILLVVRRNAGHRALELPPISPCVSRFQVQALERTGPREKLQLVSSSSGAVCWFSGGAAAPRARRIQSAEKSGSATKGRARQRD